MDEEGSLKKPGGGTKAVLASYAALGLIFVLSFFNTIRLMIVTWATRDDSSHGFLIPFLSLYFIYAERRKLRTVPVRPCIAGGLMLMSAGALMLRMGDMNGTPVMEILSFVIVIYGLVLTLFGTSLMKALALPLSYLLLMAPVLDIGSEKMSHPFQLVTAKMAALALNLLNIPVLRAGTIIELPNISLEVAPACSGLNYLLSIIAIAVPLAYFTQKTRTRKKLLVVSAFFVGIVANWVRVLLISLWTYYGGKAVHGPMHIFQGVFVSVIGFVFLFELAWLLNRIPVRRGEARKEPPSVGNPIAASEAGRTRRALAFSLVFLLCFDFYAYAARVAPVPLKKPLASIPLSIGNWRFEDYTADYSPEGYAFDSALARTYRNNSTGRRVFLFIGYFKKQDRDKKLITYKIQKYFEKARTIEVETADGPLRIDRTVVKNGPVEEPALFWFDLSGRIAANRYGAKLITSLQGLLQGRTCGAFVAISGDEGASRDAKDVFRDEKDFFSALVPVLNGYLPGKDRGLREKAL
ncbi:MAG: exosortase W [Nitrospiraceae bacterium]|nr:exosortase W [Nitrospiraceae bacterium]